MSSEQNNSDKILVFRQTVGTETFNVWQRDNLRWLVFGDDTVQTLIDLQDPRVLPSPVSRAMLAPLMFMKSPRNVLLVGAGGGAIARYLSARCDVLQGRALEYYQEVASIARNYFEFPVLEHKWCIVVQDARRYLADCDDDKFDLIVIDIAEHELTPKWVLDPVMLAGCKRRLRVGGFLSLNMMVESASSLACFLSVIREVFGKNTACMSIPEYRNVMIFACCEQPDYKLTDFERQAGAAKSKWELEFDTFLGRMRRENPADSGLF